MKKFILLLIIPLLSFSQYDFSFENILRLCVNDNGFFQKEMIKSENVDVIYISPGNLLYSYTTVGEGIGVTRLRPTNDSTLYKSNPLFYSLEPNLKSFKIIKSLELKFAYNYNPYDEKASGFYTLEMEEQFSSKMELIKKENTLTLQLVEFHAECVNKIENNCEYIRSLNNGRKRVYEYSWKNHFFEIHITNDLIYIISSSKF